MRMTVHVTTKPGFKYRPRAALMWPAGTFDVHVVESPALPTRNEAGEILSPVEVTAAQLDEMRADRPWFVFDEPGGAETIASLKAQIADLNAEVLALTAHLESVTKPKGK